MNYKKIAIFLILICCLMGAASAAEDISTDAVDAGVVDAVAVDAVSEDVSDSVESVVEDEPVVDESAPALDENDDMQDDVVDNTRTTPQTYNIGDETAYDTYIGATGLNGNPGDTYNFVSNFNGKTVYIDKDNTTITSASGVVLSNCSFRINSGISGVTINGLTIRNNISDYPIYVGPICSDINITSNNILVMYSGATYLYGIDFNAYDYGTNMSHNFNNINILDNTVRMYGNSYVCGIYGSDFINSSVLRNTIYAYTDTGTASAGNNAAYGIALCDDSTWSPVPRPRNNKISNNTVTVIGQSVYGIEDFGIDQNVSDNTIEAVAVPTGSAYGIALGILDNSTINNNSITITTGDLTNVITMDMIRESNAGIRLHSNSTYNYYCKNVDVKDNNIYYNTIVFPVGYEYIQIDPGNTNIDTTGSNDWEVTQPNPYDPVYPINRVLNSNGKDILCASDSSVLSDSSVIYLDAVNGDDTNDGSESSPVKSVQTAVDLVGAGGTIILSEGTYDFPFITFQKSVSFKGTNRENTILNVAQSIYYQFNTDGDYFVDFSNLTIKNGQVTLTLYNTNNVGIYSNWVNVTFEKVMRFGYAAQKEGSYLNIINCSFTELGIFRLNSGKYSVNINSTDFFKNYKGARYIIEGSAKNPVSINYCSFINCTNIVKAGASPIVSFNNSYFGMNDNPSSITNVDMDNWVVMTFENTTELNVGEDAGFLVSLTKLAHADGTFTDLEHPELLSLPSYDVVYTLIDGTEVTHTLENLKDETTLPITGFGTMSATIAGGQTLKIGICHDIALNIEKYDAIGYGGEQDLVFIANFTDITGTMTVTITGPDYSKEETLDIYGGRSFLTLKGLNAGEYTVEVAYSGDDLHNPASSSTTFQVNPVESEDITVKVYANNITFTEAADILVFVDPKGATGTVTITIDGNDVTEALDENGIASFSIKELPINDYDITVKYNGDSNFESATTTASFSVLANPVIDDLNEQLNQTKEELANVSAEAATAQEQVANLTADVATAQEQVANLTADVATAQEQVVNLTADVSKVQEQVTKLTQENTKLTGDLKTANKKASTASNNANAKIKKIKAAKSVKKSKKYTITVTLNKKVKGRFVYVAFNGKVYKAKTNAKGIAKIIIKKSALKKLAGKKVKYQVISGNSLKNKSVKVKK